MPERPAKRRSHRSPDPPDTVSMLSLATSPPRSTPLSPTSGALGDESPLIGMAEQALLEGTVPFVPLLFYGSSQSGLREWLRWVLDSPIARQKWSTAITLSGKDFSRSVGLAVTTDSLNELRERWRNHNLIVIELVEPMMDESPTSRELGRLIAQREAEGMPFILTTSRLPTTANGFPPSLSSRMLGGLSIPILTPPTRWRRHTLEAALSREVDQIDPLLIQAWLETPCSTVEEWESFLASLELHRTEGGAISSTSVPRGSSATEPLENLDPVFIAKTVASQCSLRLSDLKGSSRRRSTVLARSIAIYLIRELNGLSLEAIGQLFGHRDHTTVLHAHRKIAMCRRVDPTVSKTIETVCRELNRVPPPLS